MEIKTEIDIKLNKIIKIETKYQYVPEYDLDGEFEGIRALVFDSMPYQGKKTKVFGYFGIPDDYNGGKLPAVVLIHGGGGHAYAPWVKLWNKRGYAAIAIDTTGFMPCAKNAGAKEGNGDERCWKHELGDFYEDGYTLPPDNDHMDTANEPLEEQWMYHALSAAIKANTFLRSQKCIDKNKIGVVGISWGGIITSILIGYDKRFSFAVPIYGSGFLGEGLGELCEIFRRNDVKKAWLAEDNFNGVNIPVLWLAWNDDSPFSIQSNSLSYNATSKNNSDTRLVLRNKMFHKHRCGWTPEEPYLFADSLVGRCHKIPEILNQPTGLNVSFEVRSNYKLLSATAYYIISPMTYSRYIKFEGEGERTYMEEKWKTKSCEINKNSIYCTLPQNCSGYYVEIVFDAGRGNTVVTTEFVQLYDTTLGT